MLVTKSAPTPIVTYPAPQLPLARFRLNFAYQPPLSLPAYAGSAWRGALGHALKRTVCVVRGTACPDCLLYRQCAYPYIFETPASPTESILRSYTAAPHPFVLTPGTTEHGQYALTLLLIGRAVTYLPYLIHALDQAGHLGVGSRRQVFELLSVEQQLPASPDRWDMVYRPGEPLSPHPATPPPIAPPPPKVRIQLHTPLRVRRAERYVGPQHFQFADFFSPLLRRISLLTRFHTDTPLDTNFAGLTALARSVAVETCNLHWHDWTRYSTRQDELLRMGGLVGQFEIPTTDTAPLWPYLWLGQWVHNGKGTVMGLGRYTLEPATSLPPPQIGGHRAMLPAQT